VGLLVETVLNNLNNKIFYLIILFGLSYLYVMCMGTVLTFFGVCVVSTFVRILSSVYVHCSRRKYVNFIVP